MSRAGSGEPVVVKPTNNIYTILAIIGTVVNLLGFLVLFLRFTAVFGDKANLFRP
jgi:hypothetical protein